MELTIVNYNESLEEKWDKFVLEDSINGTFLQTRNFLNYHSDNKFDEASLLIMNGTNIVAVIPAHREVIDGKLTFCSHLGSTFGGIIIGHSAYKITYLESIMPLFDKFLQSEGYVDVIMKSTSDLFSARPMALLDYEYYRFGYHQYDEIAFYLKCSNIPEDVLAMMTSSRRRDCRYSLKNGFKFKRLTTDKQIGCFYRVLEDNLKKFGATPVHTEKELLDFKNNRLSDVVRFYGVYDNEKLIAGAMLFDFDHTVLHTQYLASLTEYNKKFAMNYLDYNLIMVAKDEGFDYFSFGTSTGNHGKELNTGLALYKEGFGCEYSVNRTYFKSL